MGSRTVHSAPCVPAVGDAARRILRQRLGAVALAADAMSSGHPLPAAVHRFRVCTRRASAALKAFRPLVPRRQRRWFQRALRRIRRAAAEARDLDVIIARGRTAFGGGRNDVAGALARRRLMEVLTRRRVSAERGLAGLLADDWAARTSALLSAVRAAGMTEPLASFSRRRSRRLVERFVVRLDQRLHDASEIHRLRIETKKLRYALQVFAAGASPATAAPGDRSLRRLQSRLGEFTDRATAADRYRLWLRQEADSRCRELLAAARQRESAAAKRARRGCLRWWNASRRDRLARELRRSLRGTRA